MDRWPDLPDSRSLEEDVRWCYNYVNKAIRRSKKSGECFIDWWKLSEESRPPSKGVEDWAEMRIESPGPYWVEVRKILRGGGDEEADRERGERMRLEELRGLLSQMRLEEVDEKPNH